MAENWRYIQVEAEGGLRFVRFKNVKMNEEEVGEAIKEMLRLEEGLERPRVVLDFANRTPECLYSMFLAHLVALRKEFNQRNGGLHLCSCTDQVREIFTVCGLDRIFTFYPDLQSATEVWSE